MIIKKSILKDAIREIKFSKKIFFWLLILIVISSGFYIGINQANTNMKDTIEKYYDNTNYMDIKVTSSTGFANNDIDSFKNIKDVKGVMMVKSLDATTTIKDKNYVIKVNAINKDRSTKNDDYINRLILTSGRYPSTINEGLVEESFLKDNNLTIGSLITLEPENQKWLKAKKVKIIGTVKSSYYMSDNLETSSLGEGKIDYYMYLDSNDFNVDYYNEAYITLNNIEKFDIYSKKYENYVSQKKDEILKVAASITNERYDYIISSLNDDIANLEASLNDMYNLDVPEDSINESIKITSEELNNIKEELNSVKSANVSILTRSEIPSFYEYKNEIEKVKNISDLFSLPILLISILVCIISMIKIINKNKKELMLLKTFGYNKFYMGFKYFLFAILFSIIGSVIGSLISSRLILLMVSSIIKKTYNIPAMLTSINFNYSLQAILLTCLSIVTSTFIYFVILTKKKPAKLVNINRNKKIKIFNKINLNIKKELFAVIAIFCLCSTFSTTSLLIANSTLKTTNSKYNQSNNYDLKIEFNNNLSNEEINSLNNQLLTNEAKNNIKVNNFYTKVSANSKSISNVSIIISDDDSLNNFFGFKNNNGVIISARLAKMLDVKKNDEIVLSIYNDKKFKISDIVDDYSSNCLYITSSIHKKISDKKVNYNTTLVKINNLNKNNLVKTVCNNKNVINCTFSDHISNNQKNMIISFLNITNMIFVIITVIVLIITYVLSLLNIDEFRNKLVRLKSLGVYNFKTQLWLTKEYNISIIIGTILGLLISSLLISFIATKLFLFAPNFNFYSYLLSIVINLIIIVLINIFTYFIIRINKPTM